MINKTKLLIMSWWLYLLIAIFLWYRNYNFDRVVTIFFIILGFIQLLEFCFLNGASEKQTGIIVYLLVWVQPLALWISLFVFLINKTPSIYSNICLLFIIVYFIIFIYIFINAGNAILKFEDGKIMWINNDNNFLMGLDIFYWIGILGPIFILFLFYKMKNISSIIILIYMLITMFISYKFYNKYTNIGIWTDYAIGISFLIWMSGIFKNE